MTGIHTLPASLPQTKRSTPTTSSIPPTRPSQEEWIRSRVDVTGPIEEERVRPWATVLRVPTAEGTLFKEPTAPVAHESRLIEILARRRPDLVTEVLFSDEDGRMLMRDAGPQLSSRDPDLQDWERALPLYAELQIEASEDADSLLLAGAFDRRSAVLPAQYRALIAQRAPGPTEAEYEQALALEPEIDQVCAALAASPVPETINNDDFTDGSIHVAPSGYRFLDWGDACLSHPFMTLTVTQRVIEIRHRLPPESAEIVRIRAAYLEPFTRFAPRAELEAMVEPARRIGQISRVALRAAHLDWEDDPEELAWSFRLLLDPEAWRTWIDEPEEPPRSGPVS
jgi:hypothetical protein